MPIPWKPELLDPSKRGQARTARKNGITLGQLRSLQAFVRRLCKAGLLQRTSEFTKDSLRYGSRIRWTELNMHDINEEVIKKIIPSHASCSWMEIVTSEEQTSHYFVSHNWAEAFRDFMHSLEMHAATMCCGIHDVFFVCTFANNQWHLDLGETLVASPFYRALEDSTFVVLVLDKKATALERLWCIFEITTAITLSKNFGIVTPLGLIGDKRISSGPYIEALEGLDVRMASASNTADTRQILNHIAGVDEEEGLTWSRNGKKVVSDTVAAPEGSFFQYQYEEVLVKEQSPRFEALNTRIQEFAKRELPDESALGCTVPNVAFRAMTLAQLRAMCSRAKKYYFSEDKKAWRAEKSIKHWSDIKIFHLLDPFVKEQAAKTGKSSYMEVVSTGEQKPEFVVTCAFTTKVTDMVSSIEWHAEARDLPDSATYWIISTASLKEEVDAYIAQNRRPPSFEAMPYSEGMVCILDEKASILTRALPAVEVFDALQQKKMLDLVCPTGALATTRPFKEGWEFGCFDPVIAKHMIDYDVKKINGSKIGDIEHAEMVKCMIAGEDYVAGKKAPEQSPLYEAFSERIRSKAFGPVLREAAYDGDFDVVREVLSRCKIPMDSPAFCGHSGENPMHAAAAGGHDDIVQMLFLKQASPNLQDVDGETPLHYAALAGRTSTVTLLLRMGADPTIESYFGETVEMVAEQNPAFFLGVDSSDCVGVLKSFTSQTLLSDLQARNLSLRQHVEQLEEKTARLRSELEKARLQKNILEHTVSSNVESPFAVAKVVDNELEEASIDQLCRIFSCYDKSGTGKIAEKDMEAVFRHLNSDLAGSVCAMCREAGKVENGFIQYKEFLVWVFERKSPNCISKLQ